MRFTRSKVKDKPRADSMLKIREAINKRLRQLSDYLERRSNTLSIKTKRIGFFSFCLLFGTVSLIVLLKGFFSNNSSVAFTSITVPAYAGKPNKDFHNDESVISKEEFEHIEVFKHYLDSLKGTRSGKLLFDSLMIARPHLLDSISLLENMYQIQSLKR